MHQVNISAVMDDYIPRFQGGVACVESVYQWQDDREADADL